MSEQKDMMREAFDIVIDGVLEMYRRIDDLRDRSMNLQLPSQLEMAAMIDQIVQEKAENGELDIFCEKSNITVQQLREFIGYMLLMGEPGASQNNDRG